MSDDPILSTPRTRAGGGKRKKNKDPVRRQFRSAIKAINDETEKEVLERIRVGQFSPEHPDGLVVQLTAGDQDTFLHAAVNKIIKDDNNEDADDDDDDGQEDQDDDVEDSLEGHNKNLALVIQHLVQRYPGSLAKVNKTNKTPLHMAIEDDHDSLVRSLTEPCPDAYRATALATQDDDGNNCLHAAIDSDLTHKTVLDLINQANESILKAQNRFGHTPLHLAVAYEKCDRHQLKLVKALVEKGNSALDVETSIPSQLSVYCYHGYTRKTYAPPAKGEEGKKTQSAPGGYQKDVHEGKQDAQAKNGVPSPDQKEKKPPPPHPEKLQPLTRDEVPSSNGFHESKPGALRRTGTNSNKTAAIKDHDASAKDGTVKDDVTKKEREDSANEICEFLKLLYVRTRDADQVATWLYGKNPDDVQTMFDHFEAESGKEVNAREFAQVFEHFHFDTMLKFVHFRHVTVKGKEGFIFANGKHYESMDEDLGLTDLKFFFNWLRESKGVQRIIKVTVQESPDLLPHSDQVIEACLKDFKVEILDWRKVDLCPQVLCCIGAQLQEVTLLWSGTNAVLRGWSEPEGLLSCPNLTTVILQKHGKGLENSNRVKVNIVAFRERLKQHALLAKPERAMRVEDDYDVDNEWSSMRMVSPSPQATELDQGGRKNTHKWVECIDRFANKVQIPKKDLATITQGINLPELVSRDVRVAVVDDGVDIGHHILRQKFIGGKSFDKGPLGAYRISTRGHGTIMAGMIVRVCPTAKIYVVKVQTFPSSDSELRIDVLSAAKAIQAAVDQGVDIICMAWKVEKPADHTLEKKELENSLNAAAQKGILMFCSSGDFGNLEDTDSYPAAHSRDIFCIGASTDLGKARDGTPPLYVHYLLPGQNVMERKPKGAKADVYTGSSVATALASGLAALVIYCVKLAAIYTIAANKGRVKKEDPITKRTIEVTEAHVKSTRAGNKTVRNMKAAFDLFGKNEYNVKFLEVWRLLERDPRVEEKWKSLPAAEKMAVIAKFGQDFVNARGSE